MGHLQGSIRQRPSSGAINHRLKEIKNTCPKLPSRNLWSTYLNYWRVVSQNLEYISCLSSRWVFEKSNSVPGPPAFHPYPSLILLSIGKGKGKQPTEHPALQRGAGRCNHKPWAKSSHYASDLSQRRAGHSFPSRSGLLFTHAVCMRFTQVLLP